MKKNLNTYETVIIVSASLEDEDIEKILKRYEEFFKNNEVQIIEIEKWGRKRMAYHIKKVRTGYYFIIRFKSDGAFVKKFERTLQIDEQILRYLTVKLDKRALKHLDLQRSKPVPTIEEEELDLIEDVSLNSNLDEQEISNNN